MKLLPHLLVLAGLSSQAALTQANDYRYLYTLTTTTGNGWTKVEPTYDAWKSSGEIYGCSNWSPSTSSIGKGISFVQKADDCKQDQTRLVHPQRRNDKTGVVEPIPNAAYTESKSISASKTRDEIGVLENWLGIAPTYTSWTDTNALYGCTAWSPNPSTFTTTNTFTQTSSSCKTDQERQRQDREQERFTEEVRNSGEPVTEQQTLSNQNASRPYSVTLGSWTAVGESYACSNWSPAASTIGKGTTFTQTATDCKVDQTRTRAESFKDHKTGENEQVTKPNEYRTLTNQSGSKQSTGTMEQWSATTPTYTAWVNTSALNACSNWSPTGASKTTTTTFSQTASNCTTDQSRARQDREIEQNTGEIRDKGTPIVESQTLTSQTATRSYSVTLGTWINSGAKYACSNWSPAPSTVTVGQGFTQTATDCKQDQTRTRSESYVDHKTGTTVAVTVAGETQTLTGQSNTQGATGTKETWAATTPTYTAWTNTNALYGCSIWAPSPSSKTATATFTQTASDCESDQTRNRQDREQESTTLAIRNKGTPVVENQTLTAQSATRNYTVTLGAWTNNGAKYACSNWSPAPSTVTTGQSFTQTATDCKQDQTRTRAESYVDHKTGSTVAVTVAGETQTLTGQSNTQPATGTKETWAATTPTYTAWTSTKALYGCSVWMPAPSSKTATSTFTQTASDCETDQTRNRQDREQESTTLAIRNKGTAVAESQTLTGQTATRSYTVTLGTWTDSGAKYGCTNWSPATTTVAMGEAFTQNATDCSLDQSRTRNESYVDHLTGQVVAITPTNETQTLRSQADTRAATGTAAAPTASLSAPTAAFINTPLTLTWSGTNVTSYALRGSAAGSGFSTTNQAVVGSSTTATPTAAGSYVYTLTATNAIGVSATATRVVATEAAPSIGGLNVNGVSTAISVSPSAALTFAGTGISSGALLQGRNSANSAAATLPPSAASVAGTTTYYATATKTLNGVTNVGNLKSIDVTVVDNPVIGTISASTTPFTGQAFTLNWSGTGVTSYTITGSSNNSGVPVTGVNVGTATSKAITPTVAGSYTYTITGQNAVGVTKTANKTLVVDDPSAHGVVPLTGPSGTNTALQITNGVNYSGTISQMQKGVITQLSVLIGNYNNTANGVMTLNVCGSSGGCTTGTANVVGSLDNANILFQLGSAITILKGDTLTYAIAMSGSNKGPAIWMYGVDTLGNASYLSGTNGYPYIVVRYQ
jgi:hypothetical protein